jgi:hypothetical protein
VVTIYRRGQDVSIRVHEHDWQPWPDGTAPDLVVGGVGHAR